MKQNNLFVGVLILCLACVTPAMAQSRKDKKAAKKAAWELEQKQKQEEADLKHQIRMDSIRAVQEARNEARERDRRKEAEAEAERQAAKAEQEYLKSIQTYVMPCYEKDNEEYFTAHVQRKMNVNQVTLQSTALLRLAQQQMRQKISAAYKAVVRDYMDQMDVDDKYSAASHIESAGDAVINRMIDNTEETCREMTRPDADGNVTLYLAVRVSKKDLKEQLVTGVSKNDQTKVRGNEAEFRESIDHIMNPKTEE